MDKHSQLHDAWIEIVETIFDKFEGLDILYAPHRLI